MEFNGYFKYTMKFTDYIRIKNKLTVIHFDVQKNIKSAMYFCENRI